jgi:hypothetical protein
MDKQSKTIKLAGYIIIWYLSNKNGLFPLFVLLFVLKNNFLQTKFNLALVWNCEIMFNCSFSCRKNKKMKDSLFY